ncbi:alpha-L-rhamnosidase [uncultured Pseudoflavonifractor sp.]|uniref:alpha-L-rhamnosidase n=1 Tax=uncultured Pseudoflavonifractor sp. TaxID=1221379 RepID=UPI0025EEF459|nr:alpha-L-rhamnosidase [uncultured Pseudoflavonifractor sp.]
MLTIRTFTCENQREHCVTDAAAPRFGFSLDSDRAGAELAKAVLTVNGWTVETVQQAAIPYGGPALKPFTRYRAELTAVDDAGETARAELTFETGRLDTPWDAQWISDGAYSFTEKKVSPVPMTFRKTFALRGEVKEAKIRSTAMGIYQLTLNGAPVGNEYFAPGFTSYKTNLQYQTYDVTGQLRKDNTLTAVVAGGWAVGSFVFTRKNRVTADRQALLLELRVVYKDGTEEIVGTDPSWQVTEEGPLREADLYDGEVYDATAETGSWRNATVEKLRVSPAIRASYGPAVTAHEEFSPISCTKVGNCLVYDFGQNFAGVVRLKIRGKRGQKILVRHAEILNPDGTLNTAFLRTAKARIAYTCADGEQTYSPRFTYMGFRYAGVEGIGAEDIDVTAVALYSDLADNGGFSCSDEMLNQLQSNIRWGAKSNFVDIPTDCPQRDERMGWTGDIAVFSPTACFNFDMSGFLEKWMLDVQAEQLPGGGIPNTVPVQGYGFPATMPAMAVDWWGDACVLVPWAEYMARGDLSILKRFYPVMKKYVKACKFWAGLFSFGKKRYIWSTPSVLHFGDWVAPDVPKMQQWQARSKWTATASLCHTSAVTAQVAQLLGEQEDAVYYKDLSAKVADAYCSVFTDGQGKLLNEFQTAYVLPLQFGMFPPEVRAKAADNLARLVEKNNFCIGTGFPGTPYILFALADNGHADTAYKMLLNTKCPSWLYEVKMGATTIWERWDGLDENGQCPIGDDGTDKMISYNHYASGAVGDFLYRRVAGIEPLEAGYKRFAVKPLVGGGLTWASAWVETPYGRAAVDWKAENGTLTVTVTVPVGASCELTLPDRSHTIYSSGTHTRACKL